MTQQLIFFFFFNDTATTEIYTLSLHDALPISQRDPRRSPHILAPPTFDLAIDSGIFHQVRAPQAPAQQDASWRSEEHTSELQSQSNLVCRLLLEKKKKIQIQPFT